MESQGSNASAGGTALGAAVGTGMGMIADSFATKRQHKYNVKLIDEQKHANMQMTAYNRGQQEELWRNTNASAQAAEYRKAGLNVGLMYGGMGSGGGATNLATGNVSGQSSTAQNTAVQGMALGAETAQKLAEIEVLKAQKENIEADTENKKGGVKGNLEEDIRAKKFENDINALYREKIEAAKSWNWDRDVIKGEEENMAWEFKKAIEYNHSATSHESPKARARIAELKTIEEKLQAAKTENNIKAAEQIIKEFEANMTKEGLSPNSPWYAKLITDLLKKVGLIHLIHGGQQTIKDTIQK